MWSNDLDKTGPYGLGRHDVHIEVDGKSIAAQVSDIKWGYSEQQSYVITHLMGVEFGVYLLDTNQKKMVKANTISLISSRDSVSTKNWEVLPFTNNMVLGSRNRLRKINFLDSSEVWSINTNGSIRAMCIMNGEEMLVGMGQSLKLVDMRQGDIKSSQPLVRSPLYIVSLAGLGSAYASEVAISMPMAVLDIYIYSQISFGVVRSYRRLHGFYESRSLSPISNTKYAISVANN